jgi:hypothetical protein
LSALPPQTAILFEPPHVGFVPPEADIISLPSCPDHAGSACSVRSCLCVRKRGLRTPGQGALTVGTGFTSTAAVAPLS